MKNDIYTIICKNLIRVRILNRYSQQQIAEVLSITQPSYNCIEAGKTKIKVSQLHLLAKFYKIAVDEVFLENPNFTNDYVLLRNENDDLHRQIAFEKGIREILMLRNKELEERIAQRDDKIEAGRKRNLDT